MVVFNGQTRKRLDREEEFLGFWQGEVGTEGTEVFHKGQRGKQQRRFKVKGGHVLRNRYAAVCQGDLEKM